MFFTPFRRKVISSEKNPEDLYDQETIQRVEARIEEEIAFEKYR